MLKNAPFLITIGVDPAENEPRKESWVVANNPTQSEGTADEDADLDDSVPAELGEQDQVSSKF